MRAATARRLAERDDTIPGTDIPAAPGFVALLDSEARQPGIRKGERTRRQIRVATARCLLRIPVATLSMDQIAAEAGVSRPTLYQYFPSKEEAVRNVLADFQVRTIEMPRGATAGRDVFDTIRRTNRYYIDYVAKNAVLMERIREARDVLPELLATRQRVNVSWARRIWNHARRHGRAKLAGDALMLRVLALECMVDDVLREIFVIRNPALIAAAPSLDALAEQLSAIWHNALYKDDG